MLIITRHRVTTKLFIDKHHHIWSIWRALAVEHSFPYFLKDEVHDINLEALAWVFIYGALIGMV
jgi:hypothetical protein